MGHVYSVLLKVAAEKKTVPPCAAPDFVLKSGEKAVLDERQKVWWSVDFCNLTPGTPQMPQVRGHLPGTTGLGSCPNSTSWSRKMSSLHDELDQVGFCRHVLYIHGRGAGNSNSCGRRRHCAALFLVVIANCGYLSLYNHSSLAKPWKRER